MSTAAAKPFTFIPFFTVTPGHIQQANASSDVFGSEDLVAI